MLAFEGKSYRDRMSVVFFDIMTFGGLSCLPLLPIFQSLFQLMVFKIGNVKRQTPANIALNEIDEKSWVSHWASLLSDHPELAQLLTAWPKLPNAIKAAIQAMIETLK